MLTRQHLLDLGITEYQLDIVKRLTKEEPNGRATDEYYQRIAESNDALVVKCADRCANLEDASLELNATIPTEPARWGRYAEKTVSRILPMYATFPQLRAELERRVERIERALPAAVQRREDFVAQKRDEHSPRG